MCNNCFQGLQCLDDQQQLQKFIDGFTARPRPRPIARGVGSIAPFQPPPTSLTPTLPLEDSVEKELKPAEQQV